MCTFGRRLLSAPPGGDAYALRYKGTAAAMTAVQRALTGNYVNFGVFDLYGDRALADALDCVLACACAVPLSDLMGYQKARIGSIWGGFRGLLLPWGSAWRRGAAAAAAAARAGATPRHPRRRGAIALPGGAACPPAPSRYSARALKCVCAALSCVGRPHCPYAGEQGVLRAG